MALIKTCPACERSNEPTSPFCTDCGVSLVSVAPVDEKVERTGAQLTTKGASHQVACPECGAECTTNGDRCLYCDGPLSTPGVEVRRTTVELTWPWGKQTLTQTIRIGRAPPADELFLQSVQALGLDNISRSHADLRLDASSGSVTLVDLGSRNGTFVDGVRVPANTDIPLKNGATVRFAADLALKVLFIDNS